MIRFFIITTLLMTACLPALAQNAALSEPQLQAFRSIRERAEQRAAPWAVKLAGTAKRIYENMLSDREDPRLRRRLEADLDSIVVKLLTVKGQSIREMVAVLTPEQKRTLRIEMRKPGAEADLSELIKKVFHVPEK